MEKYEIVVRLLRHNNQTCHMIKSIAVLTTFRFPSTDTIFFRPVNLGFWNDIKLDAVNEWNTFDEMDPLEKNGRRSRSFCEKIALFDFERI